jgi:hypothetical protein
MTSAERERLQDMRAQEQGGTPPSSPQFTLSPGYVWVPAGMHPDHGDAVVFAPGQLLPDWAAELLAEQRPVPNRQGVNRWSNRKGRANEQAR